MSRFICMVCNFIYDEEKEGVEWEDVDHEEYECPQCGAPKQHFQ